LLPKQQLHEEATPIVVFYTRKNTNGRQNKEKTIFSSFLFLKWEAEVLTRFRNQPRHVLKRRFVARFARPKRVVLGNLVEKRGEGK
jgi:hypothetical protein